MATSKFLNTALSGLALYSALKPNSSTGPKGRYNNFLSEFRSRSFARTNLFEVTFNPPSIMAGDRLDSVIHLYADSVNIPGINLATSETRRYGYGPIEKKPYAPIFNDITISFLVDGTGNIYKYFYKWLNRIVASDQYVNGNKSSANGLEAFEVEYKDNYKCQIGISTFDEAGNGVLTSQIVDAIPISLSDTSLSWGDNDQIMRISVTFTYFQHVLISSESSEPVSGQVSPLTGLQQIVKAGTAIQTLASLRKPKGVGDVLNVINNAKTIIGGFGTTF